MSTNSIMSGRRAMSSSVGLTSATTMAAATATTNSSMMAASSNVTSNGGHSASPYLRRFRLPKLNTIRRYNLEDENEEDDDEWFEIQMAKCDLIKSRMNERNRIEPNNNRLPRHRDIASSSSSSNSSTSKNSCQHDGKSREMMEREKTKRSPFFHPKHLFAATNCQNIGAST